MVIIIYNFIMIILFMIIMLKFIIIFNLSPIIKLIIIQIIIEDFTLVMVKIYYFMKLM